MSFQRLAHRMGVTRAALFSAFISVSCTSSQENNGVLPLDGGHHPSDGGNRDAGGQSEAWPLHEWTVLEPEQRQMDSAALERAREYAFRDGKNTQGVVVVRGGAIVAEWYADGASANSWAASWSVAKSFTSALIGIAVEEGLIDSVDVPMTSFIPEWIGTDKEGILLRHVLHMASGLVWNENYDPTSASTSDVIQLAIGRGAELDYVVQKDIESTPGTVFNYSSGNTMLLSTVLEQATGRTAAEYAREKLFEPLAIEAVDWWRSAAGPTLTYCCLDMSSRDFARFGLLFARRGKWGENQLIAESWVDESVAPSPANAGYGYQWWLLGRSEDLPPDTFAARGVDRQLIYVVPHLDLVVVRNGLYVKHPGEPVADPSLFVHYPPFGLVSGRGTTPPDTWNDAEFLNLVLEAILPEP